MEKVKCERCLRIRDLFQYIHFEPNRFVEEVKDLGLGENPRYTTRMVNLAQSRGLCEECAVEVNKRQYDDRGRYSDEMKDEFVTELSRKEEDKFYKKVMKTEILPTPHRSTE